MIIVIFINIEIVTPKPFSFSFIFSPRATWKSDLNHNSENIPVGVIQSEGLYPSINGVFILLKFHILTLQAFWMLVNKM